MNLNELFADEFNLYIYHMCLWIFAIGVFIGYWVVRVLRAFIKEGQAIKKYEKEVIKKG